MATNVVELDPLFVRALRYNVIAIFQKCCYNKTFVTFTFRLLHSKSKDSEIQLKSLLDECIRQRKAGLPLNIPAPPQSNNARGSSRESEKNLDRLKRDLSQTIPGVINKKPRIEVGGGGRLSSSMTPSPTSTPMEEPEEMEMDLDL